jgi:hypothetical protein
VLFATSLWALHIGLEPHHELWRRKVDCFVGRQAALVDLPLSMFRDGELNPFGRPLFQILIAIGCLALVSATANYDVSGLLAYAGATGLLILVAGTPSGDAFHGICSFLVFTELILYMGYALGRVHERLFACHTGMIVAIAWHAGSRSYGVWQRAMVVYLLICLCLVAHASVPRRVRPSRLIWNGESNSF